MWELLLRPKVYCSFVISQLVVLVGKLMIFCFSILILNNVFENRLTIMTVEYELVIFLIQIPNLISIRMQKKSLNVLDVVFITI